MKKLLLSLALLGGAACVPRPAAADFSLAIAQPGFSVVIGDAGPPPGYYVPPVAYVPPPVPVVYTRPAYYVRPVYDAPRFHHGRGHGFDHCRRGRWH